MIRADLAQGELPESRLLAYVMGAGLLMLIASLPTVLAERAHMTRAPAAHAACTQAPLRRGVKRARRQLKVIDEASDQGERSELHRRRYN